MADSLSRAAADLYALPPAEFTAARDELARQARSAGQRDDAALIKKLARPTVSAWLVNQLVRTAQQPMSRLFELGQALHAAQQELAGDRLRELSAQRRQVIAELMPEASRLAASSGVTASGSALDELRATLEAALVDAGAREAVQSGQLTRALSYAGIGEVDLAAALAVLPDRRRAAARTVRRRGGEHPGLEGQEREAGESAADRARQAVEEATAEAADAAQELAAAQEQAATLAAQRQFLSRRLEHLRNELERAEAEDRELAKAVRAAQRAEEAAARAVARAERRLGQARERA